MPQADFALVAAVALVGAAEATAAQGTKFLRRLCLLDAAATAESAAGQEEATTVAQPSGHVVEATAETVDLLQEVDDQLQEAVLAVAAAAPPVVADSTAVAAIQGDASHPGPGSALALGPAANELVLVHAALATAYPAQSALVQQLAGVWVCLCPLLDAEH